MSATKTLFGKKVPELMFNDAAEGGSTVMELSPMHCRTFGKNMIQKIT
jgi:hypothetical protein